MNRISGGKCAVATSVDLFANDSGEREKKEEED
jgi:hypothetical protein